PGGRGHCRWIADLGGFQTPGALPVNLAVAILVCCAGTALTVLWRRAGIGVTDDYVIVRGALGIQRIIPWSSVAGFALARPPLWRGDYLAVYVVCNDGKPLYTSGVSYNSRKLAWASEMRRVLEVEHLTHGPRG